MVFGMIDNKNSYDYVAYKFIPQLKARAAMVLFNKYRLTQQNISKMLGVSQAEVSKYLKRGNSIGYSKIKIKNKDIDAFAKSIIMKNEYDAQKAVCKICPKGSNKSCYIMIK
jgi:predicted transcriptional regulator